jgi:hypothetical protein
MEHWKKAEKQTGRTPKALLEAPTLPSIATGLWSIYQDLSSGREQGFDGPATLSWTTIQSYCAVTGLSFSRFELEIIRRLDNMWVKAVNKARK